MRAPMATLERRKPARTVDVRAAMVDTPGAVLKVLYRRAFRAIRFDDAEVARVRAAATRGPVVYVLRTVSYLEFLYFNYALGRHGLPLARFANGGVRTVLLWPLHIAFGVLVSLWRLLRKADLEREECTLARCVKEGEAVLLFLRPPHHAVRLRGAAQAAALVRGTFVEALIEAQRGMSDPLRSVQLVPMTLLWGHPAVRHEGQGTLDALFGDPETPGRLRAFWQFLRYHRSSLVKVGEPIDLRQFLGEESGRSDDALARTLRFELSGRIERERRGILGPPAKNAGRVRSEVLRSRRLLTTIEELAKHKGVAKETLAQQAETYLREIAANPQRWTFVFMRHLMAFLFGRIYEGIDVDQPGLAKLKELAKQGPLVLLPGHKSHVDYLVLSYVFYENGLCPPHIAAGSNLSFFPLGFIFRRSAAFFLRRSFRGNALYASVFAAYVRRLVRSGFNVEFFVEGGRSRTGKLLSPKLGLLGMVADVIIDGKAPSAIAVPLAISYERLVEAQSYARELKGGEKKKENLGALLRARRVLRSRYGRIDLEIGEPFRLADALADAGAPRGADEEARKHAVRRLGHRVLYGISRATAITPSALVASALLCQVEKAVPRAELERRVRLLSDLAKRSGTRLSAALVADFAGAVDRALHLFVQDEDVETRGTGDSELIVVPEARRLRLEFYKNNALHGLGDVAIVARAILSAGERAPRDEVRALALGASKLLKNELVYRPGAGFDAIFAETLAHLDEAGLIALTPGEVAIREEGRTSLPIVAGQIASYLETYALVVRVLSEADETPGRDLATRILAAGERDLLLSQLRRSEALSKPIVESALAYVRGEGALGVPERLSTISQQVQRLS
jgi:glycerol-3-phosphate O-acyltransferase